MKIHTVGTCAGTEHMPTRQHACCVFEINEKFYCFDAGSGCSRTAWLSGLPIPKFENIFLSHPHRDHIGGLPDLFWNIRKLVTMRELTYPEKITLYMPSPIVWKFIKGFMAIDWDNKIQIVPEYYADGVIFEDENIKIEARHNLHLGEPQDGKYASYSFRITAEGKKFIYSGDVRRYTDMGDWLEDCDLLMMETGHHKASDVCAGIRADGLGVKEIMFVHSGREILNDYNGAKERAEAAWGKPVIIAEDGNTYTF